MSNLESWKRQLESYKNHLESTKNSKAGAIKRIDELIKNSTDPSNKKRYREEKQRLKEHWDAQIRQIKKNIDSHKFYKPKN
jgi:hypothetical protein